MSTSTTENFVLLLLMMLAYSLERKALTCFAYIFIFGLTEYPVTRHETVAGFRKPMNGFIQPSTFYLGKLKIIFSHVTPISTVLCAQLCMSQEN